MKQIYKDSGIVLCLMFYYNSMICYNIAIV